MVKKKEEKHRSINSRLNAAIAEEDYTPVAGITPETVTEPAVPPVQTAPQTAPVSEAAAEPLRTKKATTVMPKEVFAALQRYCTESDTPKHRAMYLFIIDGLHRAAAITDEEYQRYREMASLLTTTYEKK